MSNSIVPTQVNVLDETYNPNLREAIKTYSQWPTIPQVWYLRYHSCRKSVRDVARCMCLATH